MRNASLLLLGLAGCSFAMENKRESLTDATAEYARGIKWSRAEMVRPYLPKTVPASLDPGLLPATLQVTGCEVESVNVAGNVRQAAVTMRVEWYLTDQMRVYSSLVLQSWRYVDDKRWEVFEQRTVQGAPFPPPKPGRIIRGTAMR